MPYTVPIKDAQAKFPDYEFVKPLTPSAQKAAFHVRKGGRDLCLKLISPDYAGDRLQREIQALRRLSHPNVVKLVEYTFTSRTDDDRHYIVEEFVDGQDLSEKLTGTPWPQAEAAGFFAALASGLEALRAAGIVHRDLKPHNVRVRPDGSPVIIDFGLARHLAMPDLTATIEGAGLGTPLYFAPEQFEGGKRDIDHRTDLFALGVIMYQALIGGHPFGSPAATDIAALRTAVCGGGEALKSPELDALPKPWRLLVRKLLARERVDRPLDAAQVAQILGRISAPAEGGVT